MLFWNSGTTTLGAGTNYIGWGTAGADPNPGTIMSSYAATLSNLVVHLSGNPAVPTTFTVLVGGIPTSLTVTVPTVAPGGSDLVDTAIVPGDSLEITIQETSGGTPGVTAQVSVRISVP
jgi:mannose/fructose/N-acetylgalactosamine-specific phosphotransferase system component IIC